MKFSKSTIEILKNFSEINPSLCFKEGNQLRTITKEKTILAKAIIDEHIDSEFSVYQIPRFLNLLSTMNEPDVSVKTDGNGRSRIFITDTESVNGDELKTEVNYAMADKGMFVNPPAKDLEIKNPVVSFTLQAGVMDRILKKASILSLKEIVFLSQNGRLKIRGVDNSNSSSDTVDLGIPNVSYESDLKDFYLSYKVESFKFMDLKFNVTIDKAFITEFASDKITYWIVAQSNSVLTK